MRLGVCQGGRAARRGALLAFCAALLWSAGARATGSAEGSGAVSYHGFTVELSGFGAAAETQEAVKAVKEQIDMVERVGLNGGALGFFRGLKLRISSNLRGYHGIYRNGEISLAPGQLDGHNPTLLHEFMHAYHERRLPGGFANKDIAAAFKDASGVKRYEGTNAAYFLTNSHEFFAVTATLYLWGSLPYNRPFSRGAIREAQPEYYKFLAGQFGAR